MRRSYRYLASMLFILSIPTMSYASSSSDDEKAQKSVPAVPDNFKKFTNFDDLNPFPFTSSDVLLIDPRNTVINRGGERGSLAFEIFFQNANAMGIPYFFIRHGSGASGQDLHIYLGSERNTTLKPSALLDNHPVLKARNGVMLNLKCGQIPQDFKLVFEAVRTIRPDISRLVYFTQDYDYLNFLQKSTDMFPFVAYFKLMPSEIDCFHAARYALIGEEAAQWALYEGSSQLTERFLRDPESLMRPLYKPFENGQALDVFKILHERGKDKLFVRLCNHIDESHHVILRLANFIVKGEFPHAKAYSWLYVNVLKELAKFYNARVWPDLYKVTVEFLAPYPTLSEKDRLHWVRKLFGFGPDFLRDASQMSRDDVLIACMERIRQDIVTEENRDMVVDLCFLCLDIIKLNEVDVLLFAEALKDKPKDYRKVAVWLVEYSSFERCLPYLYEEFKYNARSQDGSSNPHAFDGLVLPILELIQDHSLRLERAEIFAYMEQSEATLDALKKRLKKMLKVEPSETELSRYSTVCGIRPNIMTYALEEALEFTQRMASNTAFESYELVDMAVSRLKSCRKCMSQVDVDTQFQVLDECYQLHPWSRITSVFYTIAKIPMVHLRVLWKMFQNIDHTDRGETHINDLVHFFCDFSGTTEEQIQAIYDEFESHMKALEPRSEGKFYANDAISPRYWGFWNVMRAYMNRLKDKK